MQGSAHRSILTGKGANVWTLRSVSCKLMCYMLLMGRCNAAGWHEKTPWKEGLAKTVEWYRIHGLSGYWDNDAVEKSLDAHPTYFASQNALTMPALGLPHNSGHS